MEPPSKRRRIEEVGSAIEIAEKIQNLVHSLVSSNGENKDISSSIVDGYMLFLCLKSHNQKLREATEKKMDRAKQASSTLNKQILTLQNLQYEKNHYTRGIQACRNFADLSNIELVSEEAFLSEFPRDPSTDDDHKIMIKRLEHERQQRISLQEKYKELCVRRQLIAADNLKRQAFLDNLPFKVASLVQAATPIREYLELPSLTNHESINKSLPSPLYFLSCHLVALQESSSDLVSSFKIVGDPSASVDAEDFSAHPLSLAWTITCSDEKHPITTTLHVQHLPNLNVVTVEVQKPLTIHHLEVSATLDTSIGCDHLLIGFIQDDLGETWPSHSKKPRNFLDRFPTHKGRVYGWLQSLCGLVDEPAVNPQNLLENIVTKIKYRVQAEKTLQSQFDLLSRGKIAVDIKTKLPIRNFAVISEFNEISHREWDQAKHPSSILPPQPDLSPAEYGPMAPSADPSMVQDTEDGEVQMSIDPAPISTPIYQSPPITTDNALLIDEPVEDLLPVPAPLSPSEPPSPLSPREAGCRYFKMILKCDKDEFKALIMISPCYPQVAPSFILTTKEKHKKHIMPTQLQPFVDPQCLVTLQEEQQEKLFNNNLQLIQNQLNFFYDSFLPKPGQQQQQQETDLLYLLSYQIRKLKMCVDMTYELGKKGADSSLGKMLGRVNRGRDRHLAFDHSIW